MQVCRKMRLCACSRSITQCCAVDLLHAYEDVFRDLRMPNVLTTLDGGVFLVDFD